MTVMNSMSSRLVVCAMMVTTLLAGGCDNSQQDAVIPDQTVADNVTAGDPVTDRVTAGQAKEIARQAFFWGFHPVAYYHMRFRASQDESSPFYVGKNRFYWSRKPLTPSNRIATTPNATTLYGVVHIDLADEPYVVTILEIPTPRWTAYDAKHFGIKMDDNVPMITRERAYTSPIWYSPG